MVLLMIIVIVSRYFFGIGRTDLFSGSMDEMKYSINNTFLNFNEEYDILPGHGPSDKVKTIKENNEFIKMLIDD